MIQISSAGLREVQEHLGQNDQPGQFLVCGNSDDIAPCVQQLLDTWTKRGRRLHYFLCSGSKAFHVPCYLSGGSTFQGEELPSVEAIFDGIRAKHFSPQHMAKWFERVIIEPHANSLPLLVIECITPPQSTERDFIERLLAFSATRNTLPVVIFLHQYNGSQPIEFSPQNGPDQESLLLLYLCGGRVRASDWYQLMGSQKTYPSGKLSHPWITTRHVGSEVWFCYAKCQSAEWAAKMFESLERKERERLIRKILNSVQCPTDYPALALAGEAEDLDLPLARRAFPTLEYALTEPRVMSKYFYHLRRWAKCVGDMSLVSFATLDYLASLLCIPGIQAFRIYKVLCNYNEFCDKRILARFYGELGQRLVKERDAHLLEAAAECFQRSRRYIDEIEDLENEEKQSSIVAIANGEALLAFKRGKPELACQIEHAGLARLQQVAPSSQLAAQEVLLRTNLGDVYLRLLNNREAAMKQYQAAYSLACEWSSVAMQCYIVPKLAEALMQIGQQEQAIEILEKFLARPTDGSDPYLTIEERIALKAQLTLAQVYWQSGYHRRAALWYWRLLQRPHCLAPSVLRGISLNLRHCRPEMSQQLKAHMDSIVIRQEDMLASIQQVRDCLTTRSLTKEVAMKKGGITCKSMM